MPFFPNLLDTYKKQLVTLKIDLSELNDDEIAKLGKNIELVKLGIEVLELTDPESKKLRNNVDLLRKGIDVLECTTEELNEYREQSTNLSGMRVS